MSEISCVVCKQFNKFATCMAEPSFECRSAQVPVQLNMRCYTLHSVYDVRCRPDSLQLKHVFADCLWAGALRLQHVATEYI